MTVVYLTREGRRQREKERSNKWHTTHAHAGPQISQFKVHMLNVAVRINLKRNRLLNIRNIEEWSCRQSVRRIVPWPIAPHVKYQLMSCALVLLFSCSLRHFFGSQKCAANMSNCMHNGPNVNT